LGKTRRRKRRQGEKRQKEGAERVVGGRTMDCSTR
jgi:hypothetical protein